MTSGDQDPLGPAEREFAEELSRLRPEVVRWCAGWVSPTARAEELAQETLRVAWEKRSTFVRGRPVRPYLAGIARNLCRNASRLRVEELTADGVLEAGDPRAGALKRLRGEEQEDLLLRCLADLPRDEQDALFARYVDGAPRAEVGARLGLDDDGVRVLLQRAVRRLRRNLHDALDALAVGTSFFGSSA